MKKLSITLLGLILSLCAVADDSGSCGENVTYTYTEATKTLTIFGNGDMGFSSSGRPWENYRKEIEKVIIEEGVTSIYGFDDCSRITSVVIPKSVTIIGNYAFDYCSALMSITIPIGVVSIGDDAFGGCKGLTSVVVEEGNLVFDSRENCNAIIETTSNSLIVGCRTTVIPNSVTSIGEKAFNGCTGLTSIAIPSSVTSIGDHAFDSSGLISITIPNSVTSIGNYAFQGCNYLPSITIPNSVTTIGRWAFSRCNNLSSVTIPPSVTSIESGAFDNCNNLKSVNITDLEAWCKIVFNGGSANPLSQPYSQAGGHLYLNGEEITNLVFPNSLTSVKDYSFAGCSGIVSVSIPHTVTSIGGYAFSGCSGLTSVTIPNTVTTIGDYSFSRCGLNSVTIPRNVSVMGRNAFSGCGNLSTVVLEEGASIIGVYAFLQCYNLKNVTIPNSVTTIGGSAFNECRDLESIILPKELKTINPATFYYCRSLKEIVIPAKVELIYSNAFDGCSSLESVKVLATNPPFAYENSFSKYDIPLYVPEESVTSYQSTSPWSNFLSIKTLSGEDVEVKVCAKPTISYSNGQISFGCETEDVKFVSNITDDDIKGYTTSTIQLSATYNITVFATKNGYQNSDVTTATLCWIDTEPKTEGVENGVANIRANAVLIQNNGNTLTIQGADDGTQVSVYGMDGTQAGATVSKNGLATINTSMLPGSVAIIKIGEKAVKFVMR